MRTTTVMIILVAALTMPAVSRAMDYFPFHEDLQYLYTSATNATWSGEAGFVGPVRSFHWFAIDHHTATDNYSIWNGHLFLDRWEWAIPHDQAEFILDSPVCLLRQPLAVGDFWYLDSHVTWRYGEFDLTVRAEVVEEVELELPYGTLPTLHIHYEILEGEAFAWTDVWLHEVLGIVRFGDWELTGIESTVRIEATTLANVRSLFR